MGEVLFRYWPGRTPLYQMAFRYWYSRTTEYRFAYHRYVTSVDASKLKGPVAITKVASGFRRIEDCFWAHNNDIMYDIKDKPERLGDKVNHLEEFFIPPLSEKHKNLAIMRGNAFMYSSKEMSILNDVFANKDIPMSIYQDAGMAFGYGKDANDNGLETVTTGFKEVNDKGYISIVPPSGRTLNKNDNIIAHKNWPETITGEQLNAKKTVAEWSVFEQILSRRSWPEFNIYEQTSTQRTWPEFNVYEQIASKKIRPLSENIYEQLSGSRIWKLMDIYNNMYSVPYDRPLNELPNDTVERIHDDELARLPVLNAEPGRNMFEMQRLDNYTAERAVNILSILENIRTDVPPMKQLFMDRWQELGVTEPEIEWKIFEQIMMSIDDRNMGRYENIIAQVPEKALNGIAQLFGWRNDPQAIIGKDEQLEPIRSIIVNIRHDVTGNIENPQVNWTSQIYGERPQPAFNVYDEYIARRPDKKFPIYLPGVDIFPARKDAPVVNMFQGVSGHTIKDAKEVICNVGYSVENPPTTDTVLNMDTFVIHDVKYTVVFKEPFLQGDGKESDGLSFTPVFGEKAKGEDEGSSLFQQPYSASKAIKKSMILYKEEFVYGIPKNASFGRSAMVDKSGKVTIIQYTYPFLKRKNCKDIRTKNGVWTSDSIKNQSTSLYGSEFAKRPIWGLSGESVELLWGDKDKKPLWTDDANEWVSKYKKPLGQIDTGLSADRRYYQLFGSLSDDVWTDRNDYPLSAPKNDAGWTDRAQYSMGGIKDQEEFLEKIKYSMWSEDQAMSIYRTPYDMNSIPVNAFLQRTKYELDFIKKTTDFAYRKPYILSRFDQPDFLYKLMKPIQVLDDIESLWRTSYNLDLFIGISSEATVFVPITRTRHNAFIDRMNEFLWRYPYLVGNTFNGEFMSPIPRDVWMEYDPLFSFREPYKAMLDYKNEMIFKLNVKSAMQRTQWSCDKLPKHLTIDPEDEWTSKTVADMSTFHQIEWYQPEYKPVWMYNPIEPLYRTPKNLALYTQEWIDSTPNLLYYTYGVFADHFPEDLAIFDGAHDAEKKQRELSIANPELWLDRKWRDIFIEDVAFTGRELYESNLYREAVHLHRKCKEIEEFTNDYSNWAWVYEVPDPLEPEFGIDELLLPENDTRYSDFNEIIFNPATMRPRNPVKQIDSTTFIAKYPTKHPFPERADAGRYYDDSAIKFENYYGIETEVMYKVYLQFFKIWQSKIFEFGGMDMVNATKKMLEYIYTWIIGGGLPLEKLQQGLRVYRQIRWYAESAVIRNSQYVVTYELDALHSNLHTGKCDIPNDLHPGGSMFVDQNLAVIRCDPSTVNNGPASVTFFLDTYKNSIMTFSLLNTVGSVNIYVDNVLVDTRSTSGRVSVDLIYTGDTIEVKLEKDAANNRNKYFYIGDITVPDLSYKDLKVSFDPTLKMGNKPLDEVMKKMLQYANLYDDINEAYDRVRKGNLGVNETYRLMLQYWELHHKNKIKGKRLTIKET